MSSVMYDAVTVDEIPVDAPAVAGYVGGHWPTFPTLRKRFRHAHRLSIAVTASEDADCLDVETGDASPSEAAQWVERQQKRGVRRPVLYASESVMPSVIADLKQAQIHRDQVRLWSAHYGAGAHICSPKTCHAEFTADATQWTDNALGRNLDESLCADSFWTVPAARKKPARKKLAPKRKVTAAGLAAALSTGIFAVLAHHGVHLTQAENQAISGAAALIAGYLTPES